MTSLRELNDSVKRTKDSCSFTSVVEIQMRTSFEGANLWRRKTALKSHLNEFFTKKLTPFSTERDKPRCDHHRRQSDRHSGLVGNGK